MGTVEQNSLTPNSRIYVTLESYEQVSPKTQQHNMIIVCRKTCNAYEASTMWSNKMELSNKSWLNQTSITIKNDHNGHSHLEWTSGHTS